MRLTGKLLTRENLEFALFLCRSGYFRDVPIWLESRSHIDYLMTKPSPWLVFSAIRWLDDFMSQCHRPKVFEYGSGGSTLYWIRQGCECISIEDDEDWFLKVKSHLRGANDIDFRHVPPEIAETAVCDPANPHKYRSGAERYKQYSFERYVRQIDDFSDDFFDLILIDGRARPSCLLHAIPKVRLGGAIVLDNADRAHYLAKTRPFLKSFKQKSFTGAAPTLAMLNRTDVFIRE